MAKDEVRFRVTVKKAKEGCEASHKVGDTFVFGDCTPHGLCGSAYHTMYPILHALRMGAPLPFRDYGEQTEDTTTVTCPDDSWVTFEIKRLR